ncbi:hypothetical protein CDCA_CDCA10G3021 [Cyanidium caldarium]|uniref:GP-PDE domain-containing protein n=1 Tax=Cyanidium caldarium TaxID=2771 RepID=A0AAV9IY32_CYACA|nr:hypothetical protein CDCA_CDCA10G3021 [Cyanidium caldarium]
MESSACSLQALDEAVERAVSDTSLRDLHFRALPSVYAEELDEARAEWQAEALCDRREADCGPSRWIRESCTRAQPGRQTAPKEAMSSAEVATQDIMLRLTLGAPRSGSFQPLQMRSSRLQQSSARRALALIDQYNVAAAVQATTTTTTGLEDCSTPNESIVIRVTGPNDFQHDFCGWSNDWMSNTVVFHADQLGDLNLLIGVFLRARPPEEAASDTDCFLGQAAILASELSDLKGVLRRPLMDDERHLVGEFLCEFCVIKPYCGAMPRGFSHLRLDMVPSVAPQRRFQLVGHRGAGSQRTKSRVQENTVLSFLTAIQRGTVDTIELDVQLTRDGVPVIYHDFFLHSSRDESGNESDEYHEADDGEPVRVEMNGTMPAARALADKSRDCRRSGASGSRKPPDGIPIYSLTYDAFKSMTGKRSLRHVKFTTSSLRRGADPASRTTFPFDDWADFTRGAASEGNIGYLQHRLSMEEGHDDQGARGVAMIRDNALPSLRRVLNVLPEHISLMVEIKYPTPELMADTSLPYPERNVFVDRILEVIFQNESRQRRIVFLSFDPDVCLMVRKKQSVYPVCFLNAAGRSVMSEHCDPRALSVVNGVAFAVWAGLDGMVLLSDLLFEEPGTVQVIHSAGLKVYTYGKHTAQPERCRQMVEWGVDGVIADRVAYVARALDPAFGPAT